MELKQGKGNWMRKLSAALMIAALLCVVSMLASCFGDVPTLNPTEVPGANKSIEIDLSDESLTRTIRISDYINENGALNITYDVKSHDGYITVSPVAAGKEFTVTAVSVGTADVVIKAARNGIVVLNVTLEVKVTENSDDLPLPAPSAKTGVVTSYTIDLFSQALTLELSATTFVNENGAENVTYQLIKSSAHVDVSAVVSKNFTITAKSVGNAVVAIKVLQNGQLKFEVGLEIAVVDTTPLPAPSANTEAVKTYTIDLFNEAKTLPLSVDAFVNENGAENVTYQLIKSSAHVDVSAVVSKNFTITAKSVGNAVVTIKVLQNGQLKFEVGLEIAVVDTTPRASVSGIVANGAGYSMAGNAVVDIGKTYVFSIERKAGYIGAPSFEYMMNGLSGEPLTPTELPVGKFNYVIHAVTGDIVIGTVSGFIARYSVDLSGVEQDAEGYTITGDPGVTAGQNYEFTIVRDASFVGTPVISYTVGGIAGVAPEVSESPEGTFQYTIPAANINGDIVFLSIGGLAEILPVSGIANGNGYIITGNAIAEKGQSYQFSVTRAYGYNGVPSFNVTVGGSAVSLMQIEENPSGTYRYTIPASDVTGAIAIGTVGGLFADVTDERNTHVLTDGFFKAGNWANNPFGGGGTAAAEAEGVSFGADANKMIALDVPDSLIKNLSSSVWPIAEGGESGPYQMSFILKASGGFTLAFLSSGHATSPNELRLVYNGSELSIGRFINGTFVMFGSAQDAETGFETGKEFRVDIVVSAILKNVTADGLVDPEAAEQANGLIKIQVFLDGEPVVFKNGDETYVSNTATSGHYFRLEDGDTYIQRLNLQLSNARYGKHFVVNASGGALVLSPIPSIGLILGAGEAQFSGAHPFAANTWFRRSSGSQKPSTFVVGTGGGVAGSTAVSFSNTNDYALKVPYRQNQHFTFAMRSTDGYTGETVQMWLRARDGSNAPDSYYYIGINNSRFVFSKNATDPAAAHLTAPAPGTGLVANKWHQVDIVFTDMTGKTEIALYLDRQKVVFALAGETDLTVAGGTVYDENDPIQDGDYFGFRMNRSGGNVALAQYIGNHAAQEILLKDAYQDLFPIGMTVQTSNTDRYDKAGLSRHFNSLTAEFEMKWSRMQKTEGTFNWVESDKLVTYAKNNDKKIRGHALVWYKSIPSWIFADIPEAPDEASKTKLLNRISTHVETVVKYFDDTVYCWDVVNEAITNQPNASEVTSGAFYRTNRPGNADAIDGVTGWDWYKYCGTEYIHEAFRAADRARTEAGLTDLKLFYNDYNLMFANKRNAVVKMAQELQAAGVPIDGIGMQSHFKYDTFSAVEFEKSVKAFTDLGLDVQITELDISLFKSSESTKAVLTDEEFTERSAIQQKAFEDIFRIVRKYTVPQTEGGGTVTGLTFWGVADDASWLSAEFADGNRKDHGLFFDRQFSKKPAFEKVIAF